MATELAKAYVQIIPSAQGIQGSISEAMGGEGNSAGESSGKSFASSFGSVAKKALVGLGIGKIISDGINSASEFGTAMAKTSTLFSGTSEEFDALQSKILDLSGAYGLSATMLAEAAYSAESASVPMEQLGPMLEGSAKLAISGFTDIDTALSATAKTMNAYGDAAMSAEEIQKVLIQTQNLGITTVGELGASLANVTPTAAAMGVGFDQVGAALAQMTAQGVPTAQATTQLRSAMAELGKSGTKADIAFRKATEGTKYAGMGFKEAIASGADLGDVFGMMNSYAEASGLSMVDLWGSIEAGNAAMMIASDVNKFKDNLGQMGTEADVVGDAYGKMANTFGNDMNRLKESATNFMTTLFQGGDISSSFNTMLSSLGDVGERLIGWITTGVSTLATNLPSIMSGLLDFGASLLETLGKVDWLTLGSTIVEGIVGAMGTLGTRLFEIVSGAITSVTSGEIDFASIGQSLLDGVTGTLGTLTTWISNLFTSVTELFGEGGISFSGIGQSIFDSITGILNPEGGNFLSKIFTDGETTINGIDWAGLGANVAAAGSAMVNLTGEALAGGFTAAQALISGINWTAVGETAATCANGMVALTGEALSAGFTAAEALINAIDWAGIGTTVGNAANGLVNLTGEALAAGFTAAEALINGIQWETIGTTVANVGNGIVALTGDVLAGGFAAAESLINEIQWETIGTTAANVGNGLIGLTGEALSAGFTAASALINTIDWAGMGETVGTVANKLVEYSGEALAAPFEAAFGILKGINWGEVGSAMQSGLGDVWSGLTGFLGGVLSGAGDAVSGIGSGIGAAAEGVGTAIHNLFSGDDAKKSTEELKKAMADLEKAMKDGETTIKETAKGIGSSIKNSVQTELSARNMSAIGRDAVLGIVHGIILNTSALVTAMTNLARAAVRAARDELDINSPSRVMQNDVGRWIPEGIAMGISENVDIVTEAMNGLADGMTGPDVTGTLSSQWGRFGGIAGDAGVDGGEGGMFDRIVSAVREGIRGADISLFMDGQRISERVNEYLGEEIAVRRFA